MWHFDVKGAGHNALHVAWGSEMDRDLIVKLLCVSFVAAIMLPFGSMAFPFFSGLLTGPQFLAIEAVIGATLGFGISSAIT